MDRESDVGSSETGSGRETPRSMDQDTYRSDTPGTMPTYQYTKDELYDLERASASLVIPDCLDREYMTDNVWDPERWFRSFGGGTGSTGGSRGPSPQTTAADLSRERRERRHSTSDKALSADPKERLKEEKDGIILSPQRRSFGTGCHVSHQPLLQRALSNIVDGDRRETRRIGSGRIQIDRDRDRVPEREREYTRPERDRGVERVPDRVDRDRDTREFTRADRGSERDTRDFSSRNERLSERDTRDFRRDREIERGGERDSRDSRDFRNSRDSRDRFEREDRDRDRRYGDRDRMFISRRDLDERARERDFRDFSGRQNRRDRHPHKEEEPEWFSSGPISKNDTIELHGFADREKRKAVEKRNKHEVRDEPEIEEEEDYDDGDKTAETTGINVADRNGSLETNESSSPETNQSDIEQRPGKNTPSNSLFDFNEFFKIENLPGIVDDPVADQELNSLGGSRFYQLYRNAPGGQGSRENSRRSSMIEDEFGYLNDLLNGSKSPVLPSPPPTSAAFDQSVFLSPYANSDKQQHIEFGTVSQKLAQLGNNNPLVSALMKNASHMEKTRNSPPVMKNSPQDTEAKLKAILFGRVDSTSSSGNTTPGFNSPLNVPGKVKTLAELEGEMQQPQGNKNTLPQGIRREMTPPTMQQRRSSSSAEGDLSAFNKLISLMQAGAARPVESPKIPIKVDPRPASPLVAPRMPPHGQMTPQEQMQQQMQQQQQRSKQQQMAQQQQMSQQQQMAQQHGQNQQQQHQMSQQQQQISQQQQQQMSREQQMSQQMSREQQMPHMPQPQPQQPKIVHKPEPLILSGQGSRPVAGELQFGSVDTFSAQMTTPTSGAPPLNQDALNEANAAQKQFLQALQRNKEQQLQIRHAAIQNMRMHHNQSSGQPGQPQQGQSQSGQMAQPSIQQQQQQQTPGHPSQNQQQPGVQPVRRLSTGDPIMNFVKANPTIITKVASPTPPPTQPPQSIMNMVGHGGTPRGPSPSPILQQALLSQQPPGSPRVVPSPIMFSQQPPMHLSAPSPIHPSQGGSLAQSPQPGNTNTTNTIRPPSVPRVPSPQELIVHTQAILQNALIKKQLEDQKERFYKKQQERGKSPNPMMSKSQEMMKVMESVMATSGIPTMVSTMPPMPSTPVAQKPMIDACGFTPTSVIRKMHAERASEKEQQRRDSTDVEALEKQVYSDSKERPASMYSEGGRQSPASHPRTDHQHSSTANIPPPSMVHTVPPPPLPNQVLSSFSVMPGTMLSGLPPSFNTNQLSQLPPPPPHVSTHLPPPLLSPGAMPPPPPPTGLVTQEQMDAAKSQQLRQLIGQVPAVSSAITLQGRPIVKGGPVSSQSQIISNMSKELAALHQHQQQQQQQQQQQHQQRPIMGNPTSPAVSAVDMAKLFQQQRQFSASPSMMTRTPTTPTTPYGIPIAGRVPMQSTPIVAPQPHTPVSNSILMQQMFQGGNHRSMNQLTQLATLQAQQRVLDPRGIRPPITGGVMPQMMSPRNFGTIQSTVHNPTHNAPFNPHNLNPHMNPMKNGPISPVSLPFSMVTNGNNNFAKQENVNLVKWFGHDMLKNQLPTMPPLPVQGQKVLTLDEIERI